MFILRFGLIILVFFTFYFFIIFLNYFWLFYLNIQNRIKFLTFKNLCYITKALEGSTDTIIVAVNKYKFTVPFNNFQFFIKKFLILLIMFDLNLSLIITSWNNLIKKFLLVFFKLSSKIFQKILKQTPYRYFYIKFKKKFIPLYPKNLPRL